MTKQYKNLVLLVGFVLVLSLCYKLAIINTLELKKKHTQLSNKITIKKDDSHKHIKTKNSVL